MYIYLLSNVNTHLSHHLTPVMRGPAGRRLSLWMTWTLVTTNSLPQHLLMLMFWLVIGLWVVWWVGPGRGQHWVSMDCFQSQDCRRRSCLLDRGRRRLDPACSSGTPGNPGDMWTNINTSREKSHNLNIHVSKKLCHFKARTLLGSETCIWVSGGALITITSWSGESNDFFKSWQRT